MEARDEETEYLDPLHRRPQLMISIQTHRLRDARTICLLAALTLGVVLASSVSLAQTSCNCAALENQIETIRNNAGLPAMGYALVVGDSVVLTGSVGMADINDNITADANTPYMLASLSKTYITAALLKLIESGALSLDDPVNDHLPWTLDNPRVSGEVIRVSHLVTHTSGLRDANIFGSPGSGDLYSYGDTSITLAEFMEGYFVPGGQWYNSVANFRNRMPGDQYEYSNFAAALAGYLVETITGTKLRDHSVGNLFGPLGMTNTGWHLADFSDVSLIAMPYSGNNTEIGHYSYPDYPDGQLRSSPADLGTYMAVMLGGGETSGVRVLEPESVDLAFDDVLNNHAGEGVFWYRNDGWGERDACHSGGDYGVLSDMCLLLESQVGVAVVVNHDSFAAEDALYEVFDLLVAKGLELPTAEFSTAQTSGNAPFDAEFTDLSTDGPTSWLWTFGDGGSSTLQDPNYQYTTEGDYTVTLTSTNGAGSDSETKVDHIHISVPEPALLTQLLSGVFGLFALNAYRKRG